MPTGSLALGDHLDMLMIDRRHRLSSPGAELGGDHPPAARPRLPLAVLHTSWCRTLKNKMRPRGVPLHTYPAGMAAAVVVGVTAAGIVSWPQLVPVDVVIA